MPEGMRQMVAALEEEGEKLSTGAAVHEDIVVTVREFDPARDCAAVEAMEAKCEAGASGKMSLFTHQLGDPLARVRCSPLFLMLLAETRSSSGGEDQREIIGVVRGCVKTVTCGAKQPRRCCSDSAVGEPIPIYAKVAYLLGLRVSPCHRRRGVAQKLVQRMEEWFRSKDAEYAYMATEKSNEASLRLFTGRCGYVKFRTPAILVQPVFAHRLPLPRRSVTVIRLTPDDAERLYRGRFAACTEFFPLDIDSVLRNSLSLGTFLAVPATYRWPEGDGDVDGFLAEPPESWAVLSVWNSKDVFRLEVRGAGRWRKVATVASRAVDRAAPWLRVPSVPDIFRPFGFYFLYGVGGEGPQAAELVGALCRHAHNMAAGDNEVGVVAVEVAAGEPLRRGIPHWRRLSCAEDVWCVKRLAEEYSGGALGDWTKAPPRPSIFVDPRDL